MKVAFKFMKINNMGFLSGFLHNHSKDMVICSKGWVTSLKIMTLINVLGLQTMSKMDYT